MHKCLKCGKRLTFPTNFGYGGEITQHKSIGNGLIMKLNKGEEKATRIVSYSTYFTMAGILWNRCAMMSIRSLPVPAASSKHFLCKCKLSATSNINSLIVATNNRKSLSSIFLGQKSRQISGMNINHKFLGINGYKRQFYTQDRTYNTDANVRSDVTVYSYHNDRLYRMMTIFGIVTFFFWGNLAVFAFSSLKKLDGEEMKQYFNEKSLWGQILTLQAEHKNKMSAMCALLGYAVLLFSWIYPQRAIKQLQLLKGGERLKVTTYTHFGRTRHLTVPLENVSCMQSRHSKGRTISMKIKGSWFYFNLDKTSGTFHDVQLFDRVVGLKRNLK